MKDIQTYIESGILELYCLQELSPDEMVEVEAAAAKHPEVAKAIREIEESLWKLAESVAVTPPSGLKTKVLEAIASPIDAPAIPPVLSESSKIEDYAPWIEGDHIAPPDEYDNIHFIPVSVSEVGMTVVVWMKNGSPEEVHDAEIEKFLIMEGSCIITIGGEKHALEAGDYLSIPLHIPHDVVVTSDIPCKILLQRIAA